MLLEYSKSIFAAGLLLGSLLVISPAVAQTTTRPAIEPAAPATADRGGSRDIQTIDLVVGQSKSIDAPWPVKRVSVTDPTIADVDMSSPRRIQLKGKSVGVTDVTLSNETGDTWEARLDVRADVSRLQGQLRKLFGNDSLEVAQADE